GDEVTEMPGITPAILELGASVVAVDVSADAEQVAVQRDDGTVYSVSEGRVDQLGESGGLVRPTLDPFGYTWTVPAAEPGALAAWSADVSEYPVAGAFPDASAISQIRVGPDGARLAAVLTVGNQRRIAVAAIVRDENGVPT